LIQNTCQGTHNFLQYFIGKPTAPYNTSMLTIAIQAGGESRRMGRDKALRPFLGQPLIRSVIKRLASIADEIIITTNRPADYAFLDLPLFLDLRPGCGPLSGLQTALSSASQPLVACVACDMPFASPDLLSFQARLLESGTADVVIPLLSEGYEPLHAVYRRETCLPVVEQALARAEYKLMAWFSHVRVQSLTAEDCRQYDPTGLAFTNLNTPQELAWAEDLARRML
jgi:molybdopterin-guanine dinucleotide biosynthesis protein A